MAAPVPLGGGVIEVEKSVVEVAVPEASASGDLSSTHTAIVSKIAEGLRDLGCSVSKPVRRSATDLRIRVSVDRRHADVFFVDQNAPRDQGTLKTWKLGIVAFDTTGLQTSEALEQEWKRLSSVLERVLATLFGGARPVWLAREDLRVEFSLERAP